MTDEDDPLALHAYVDGELDADARAAFEARLAADAALRERLAREQRLRSLLAASYDPVLAEPVPPALAATTAAPAAAAVIDLAARRAATQAASLPPPRARWAHRGPTTWALAASVFVGTLVGFGLGSRFGAGEGVDSAGGNGTRWPVDAALGQALEHALAAEAPATANASATRVGLSFVAHDGRYCRAFVTAAPVQGGVACRGPSGWALQSLAALPSDTTASPPTGYRQAGSPWPAELLQVVDRLRAGEVLDAAGERAARERGWAR